jgi:hypothetical protein
VALYLPPLEGAPPLYTDPVTTGHDEKTIGFSS